ncbi:MAG: IS6 family transposase [Candidatus Marinimicrobia bacterium]|nr:IS6 family transposase [Candidatus Neomarinimicrobiota bacterium]
MNSKNPFKWRYYEKEIIFLNVRWSLRYPLSYRNLEEMMQERGLSVDHSTIYRWVQHYTPEMKKRSRKYLRQSNDSYRIDETYIKVRGKMKCLYRAIDSQGNTIDFLLRSRRNMRSAKSFLKKMLRAFHGSEPRVLSVDENPAYPPAVKVLKEAKLLDKNCILRQNKYWNNIIEQDHRFIKKLVRSGMGFKTFHSAWRTLKSYEIMNMIRKRPIKNIKKGEILKQKQFIENLFVHAA